MSDVQKANLAVEMINITKKFRNDIFFEFFFVGKIGLEPIT